jgi:hypothetical protein
VALALSSVPTEGQYFQSLYESGNGDGKHEKLFNELLFIVREFFYFTELRQQFLIRNCIGAFILQCAVE